MKKLYFLPLFFLMSVLVNGQDGPTQNTEDNSIKGQFETIIRKSTNYNQGGIRYEVIRLTSLNALRQNVFDSLTTLTSSAADLKATIEQQEKAMTSLSSRLEEATKKLEETTKEKDSMPFLFNTVSKSTYKLIVWSIIIALLLILAFFIFKFRSSNSLTQQAKSALADLEQEYEQHRRRALEREQKISRELHDERNKNKKKK